MTGEICACAFLLMVKSEESFKLKQFNTLDWKKKQFCFQIDDELPLYCHARENGHPDVVRFLDSGSASFAACRNDIGVTTSEHTLEYDAQCSVRSQRFKIQHRFAGCDLERSINPSRAYRT